MDYTKCYFNYSDSGRNPLKATEKKHRMYIQAVHAQGSTFLRQLHVSNILCVLRFYLTHAHVFTTTFIVICNLLKSYASGIDCKLKDNISDRPISAKNTSTELVSLR